MKLPIRILHTNDLHGRLTEANLAPLLQARQEADLYFDTGDALKVGNLGVPLKPEEAWTLLARAGCTASVIGNRETHVLEPAFKAKLAGSSHPVLCANLRRRDGTRPLPGALEMTVQGSKIGLLAVSVPMVTTRSRTQAASTFLWDPPLDTARALCTEIRSRVDALFALTHIGFANDRRLAEACPEIDVVFGGHSHTVLEEPVVVGRTWVCQGGSHAHYMGRYEWFDGTLTGGLVAWGAGSG